VVDKTSSRTSVTIVDRNYPPNKSVIAESASDLAKFLLGKGIDVNIVTTDGGYQGGGAEGEVVGNIYRISSVYSGKQKLLRLLSSLVEGFFLIRKAKKINKGTVIVMTSPPLLNFWASILFKKKQIPWIYWSMDIYPQAFVASNLVKEGNWVYKYLYKKTYDYAPIAKIALGKIQSAFLDKEYGKKIPEAILPCGVFLHNKKDVSEKLEQPSWKNDDSKIYLGYIGNLGEAHSVSFLKNIIDHIDIDKHRVIFVLYGSKAHLVIDYIKVKNNPAIHLLDYLPRKQLKYIDIHLVSLNPDWVNLCVPSKLVSAVHQQSIFLFNGIRDCDSWQYLQRAGWLIESNEKQEASVVKFLNNISHKKMADKKQECVDMSKMMEEVTIKGYEDILCIVREKQEAYA